MFWALRYTLEALFILEDSHFIIIIESFAGIESCTRRFPHSFSIWYSKHALLTGDFSNARLVHSILVQSIQEQTHNRSLLNFPKHVLTTPHHPPSTPQPSPNHHSHPNKAQHSSPQPPPPVHSTVADTHPSASAPALSQPSTCISAPNSSALAGSGSQGARVIQ